MNIPSSRPRPPAARVVGVALVAGALTQIILTGAGAGASPTA